jgi:sigma-B regulation protein RsbU (phosphoserine phosphatase)
MKIRGKLLLLLMGIALVPLLTSAALDMLAMYSLGSHVAANSLENLTVNAHSHMRSLVEDYGRLLKRDRSTVELLLTFQAREVERLLVAGESPRSPELGRSYAMLRKFEPDLISRQQTFIEPGTEIDWPPAGKEIAEERRHPPQWYENARKTGALTWAVEPDLSIHGAALMATTPVYRPDGSLAGATALTVPLSALFQELKLPEQWAGAAERMLVIFSQRQGDTGGKLQIVAVNRGPGGGQGWRKSQERKYLEADDPGKMGDLLIDIAAGRPGVRNMRYRGEETHWVYGVRETGQPFPVIIVPHKAIIAKAVDSERHVRGKTLQGLKITSVILLGVVVSIVMVAFFFSRSVTRPINRLAKSAERLAGGDYEVQVDIRTGDEFQELGEIFNAIGPKLKEREKMERSLALARGIQQHLLPQEPPMLPGFDIFGQGIYCDETGGDYYDFIVPENGEKVEVGLAVGDVSGHGIGAALLMASARGILRSLADRHGYGLTQLFQVLNHHLVKDTDEESFLTLFYGVLDVASRSLRWNSAGHGPVLLYRCAQGEVEELSTTGIPLGILEEAFYLPAGPVFLEPGDILLIGTDGLWETRNLAGEMFGTERLSEILVAYPATASAEICRTVMNRVRDFRGDAPQEDDLTLVVVRAM